MNKHYLLYVVVLLLPILQACNKPAADPATFVNPMIGTGGHGHTFPGATTPFGLVQLSPDTRKDSWDGCSGYHYSDSTIMGFSHTHLSGTGVGDYGDIRFMPMMGQLQLTPGAENDVSTGYRASFSHDEETAEAGYYAVKLRPDDIDVELTTTTHAGLHRYRFGREGEAHIVIDLIEGVTSDKILGAAMRFENDTVVSGFRRTHGWASDQYVYFYAVFSQPFNAHGIAIANKLNDGLHEATADSLTGWVSYKVKPQESILVKVGISAVDVEGARKNLEAEIPGWDFEVVRKQAKQQWNDELGSIAVSGNVEDKTVFYTALYHTMVAPNQFSDVDGRYRGHDQQIHQLEGDRRYTVFSLWDTFRALHPLFTLIERERTSEMLRGMLDMYRQGGLLPVWELAANETNCMIGYHAVPVMVDAWQSGIRGFDEEEALLAMIKSATQKRFGLDVYQAYGYIPANAESESVSKTLEYAYDDWCIARFAEGLGHQAIADSFYQRAKNYQYLFDPSTNFIRGRQNGSFISPFDPTQVNFMLTEANTWQYNFFVPQDVNGQIALMGGDAIYEMMLDSLFTTNQQLSGREQSDITGLIGQYAHGNEPSHHMAYLYNYVGKPTKTQKYVKQIIDQFYTNQPDGLAGNEDCGQMSAWYVLSAMGFYPVTPGSGMYVLGLPDFEETILKLENGKRFKVLAKNLSDKNCYVKSVSLNGKSLERSYITQEEILQGGELVFVMTDQPDSDWGTAVKDRPQQFVDAADFLVSPRISASAKTFTDTLVVALHHPDAEAKLRLRVLPEKGRPYEMLYTEPFVIDESVHITARAEKKGVISKQEQANLYRIPAGRSIQLFSEYNPQYHAGGNKALIDHQRGNTDFRVGSWQGYQGIDLVVVVDLGAQTEIDYLAAGFLQDVRSWIFFPTEVVFSLSDDGTNFRAVGRIGNEAADDTKEALTRDFEVRFKTREARYVKMEAHNRGVCPEGHLGAGSPAWIFADEIVVE